MKTICFATHNSGKFKEIQMLLEGKFLVKSLVELGIFEDIPETASTIEGNAALKALYLYEKNKIPCFSDDSGLKVRYLKGAPGVYSARYAGLEKNDQKNISLLLKNMKGALDRYAEFVTVIAYIDAEGKTHTFTGSIPGYITTESRGREGFGYDPIFVPEGYDKTFAELPLTTKNKISHRAKALNKLVSFLEKEKE